MLVVSFASATCDRARCSFQDPCAEGVVMVRVLRVRVKITSRFCKISLLQKRFAGGHFAEGSDV